GTPYNATISVTETGVAGLPVDTDDNVVDFRFVDVAGSIGCTATPGFECSRLGAPAPQNLQSPILRNPVLAVSLFDPGASETSYPNEINNPSDVGPNQAYGTLSILRKITN